MQNAVLHHFRDAQVVIKFTNRSPQMLFNRESYKWIQERVNRLSSSFFVRSRLKIKPELSRLSLTSAERSALSKACPYFPDTYLDFLSSLRLHPETQVKLDFVTKEGNVEWGEMSCRIEGYWRECILYEVPIMSICKSS
jgi:nicotinate phosphoribosyltransferase